MWPLFCLAVLLISCFGSPILAEEAISPANDNIALSDTYPHISALENAILGQSFPSEPINERLARMEKKAFAAISSNPDLSERTDALDEYTSKQLHKNLLQANMDVETPGIEQGQIPQTQYGQDQNNQSQSTQGQADYPRVTALEQAILSQTFVGQPLPDRLSRMEIKAFGNPCSNLELSDRTDALETYAEKKLHMKPLANAQNGDNSTITSGPAQQKSGLLSKVGQTLLGMAMPNLNGVGGTVGRGGGLGFGGGGLGGSGMGYGPGFGGLYSGMGGNNTNRRQSAQQQESDPPVPVNKDDPEIYLPTPPDANAKLLVKVAWCEVKVFGHTFANMHLPERLQQLNQELKLAPSKSNIQLMDDIGLMIKTVQSRQLAGPLNQAGQKSN